MANLKIEVSVKLVTLKRDFDADRVFAHAALKEAEQRQMVDPLLLAWADTLDEAARLKRLLFGEQNRYSAESAKVHFAEKHIDELSKINEFMAEGLRQKDERIASLENQLRRQDEALKRAGSAARFAIDPARAQELKAMIGKPGVFADNGDELEKQYQEEADALERVRSLEAENAVLRQALQRVAMEEKQESISLGGDKYYRCRVCGGEGGHKGLCPLAATPSDAAERVVALVDALRFYVEEVVVADLRRPAEEALAKWEGK